jgi:hypothetical protein
MAWRALPAGESIRFRPGYSYAVVASVKANHSKADILSMVSGKGLTVYDYAEQGERAGLGPDPKTPSYREIALEATSGASGSVPWSVPWPASIVDGSSILEAWEAPTATAPLAPVPTSTPASSPTTRPADVDLRPLGALAVGVGAWKAWEWWRGRSRRR